MKNNKEYLSYEQSGVSIDANDVMVDRISESVKSTHSPRVLNMHNAFAGMFRMDFDEVFKKNYKNPVLVACTDGVGTKIIIAQQRQRFDTVGIDLVAMSVNDMIVQGAEPLFFLDYLAVNKLRPERIADMVEGIAAGCRLANCSLIGGETAEMPDLYRQDDYDMAGFAVGVVEKERIITGEHVKKGDVVLGLASSGVHSNGYSLVRNICFKKHNMQLTDTFDELDGAAIGDVLLEPTKIYVKPVVGLLDAFGDQNAVHGMAHITGGGLVGNIPRILPKGLDAALDTSTWDVPKVFKFLQEKGPVTDEEMFRVFNMGIGYILIVDAEVADRATETLQAFGETVYTIGTIQKGNQNVIL